METSEISIPEVNEDEAVDNTVSSSTSTTVNKPKEDLCRICNLIFEDESDLKAHQVTEHHLKAASGFFPAIGRRYCYLCWRGYDTTHDLLQHFKGKFHEENGQTAKVKSLWRMPRGSRSRSPSRSRLGKGVKWKCVECNLVFISERSETLHRESQRHHAVFDKRRPKKKKGDKVSTTTDKDDLFCLLCWIAVSAEKDLFEHYDSAEHLNRMTRYGVERLLLDERGDLVTKAPETWDDWIVVDQIGSGLDPDDVGQTAE